MDEMGRGSIRDFMYKAGGRKSDKSGKTNDKKVQIGSSPSY